MKITRKQKMETKAAFLGQIDERMADGNAKAYRAAFDLFMETVNALPNEHFTLRTASGRETHYNIPVANHTWVRFSLSQNLPDFRRKIERLKLESFA